MSKKEDDKKKTGKSSFLSLWFSPADEVVNQLAAELEKSRLDAAGTNGDQRDLEPLVDSRIRSGGGDADKEVSPGIENTKKNGGLEVDTTGQILSAAGDDSKWAPAAVASPLRPPGKNEGEEDTHTHEGFQRYLQRFDFYELLQIDPAASSEEVHKSYLRRVRNLIGSHEIDSKLEPWQVESLVQAISLAHEVLRDQNTRKSYDKNRDFRKFVADGPDFEPIRKRTVSSKNIHSLISLIRYAQLMTPADLDAAIALNQGKTELQIASYLVDVGKLTVEELESITLARYLIALGKITITQYEIIIGEMKETGTPLWVGLVAKGWVKMTDVLSG